MDSKVVIAVSPDSPWIQEDISFDVALSKIEWCPEETSAFLTDDVSEVIKVFEDVYETSVSEVIKVSDTKFHVLLEESPTRKYACVWEKMTFEDFKHLFKGVDIHIYKDEHPYMINFK